MVVFVCIAMMDVSDQLIWAGKNRTERVPLRTRGHEGAPAHRVDVRGSPVVTVTVCPGPVSFNNRIASVWMDLPD